MQKITVKKTNDKVGALNVIKKLPEFFTKEGIVSFKKDLKKDDLYGAFLNRKLIGFLTLRKADKEALEITWLAILPDKQGMGFGLKLVEECLNISAKKGYRICYVKTLAETAKDKGYDKTRNFYKKLGFNTLEIISPYPGWSDNNPCQILAVALQSHNQ